MRPARSAVCNLSYSLQSTICPTVCNLSYRLQSAIYRSAVCSHLSGRKFQFAPSKVSSVCVCILKSRLQNTIYPIVCNLSYSLQSKGGGEGGGTAAQNKPAPHPRHLSSPKSAFWRFSTCYPIVYSLKSYRYSAVCNRSHSLKWEIYPTV